MGWGTALGGTSGVRPSPGDYRAGVTLNPECIRGWTGSLCGAGDHTGDGVTHGSWGLHSVPEVTLWGWGLHWGAP